MTGTQAVADTEVLSGYRKVHSPDLDEARERVGEVFCPHRLEPVQRPAGGVRFNSVTFGDIGLSYLSYGTTVRIRPQPLDSFVLVQIPLRGRALVRSGAEEIASDPDTASVPDPDAELDMTWEAGNEQLIVRVDRAALDAQLRRLLGRPPSKPLRLATSLDLTTPDARSWLSTVDMLRTDLDGPGGLSHPAVRPQFEQLLMTQLLSAVPHSSSEEMEAAQSGEAGPAVPRVIRRAAQLIDDHAREDLTVDDVAEAVGLSVRSLQEGFRRHLDTTPTAHLRESRLVGVRGDLTDCDPLRCTVSQVAADWGFHHLGRFAVAYKDRFGESPSQTLRT